MRSVERPLSAGHFKKWVTLRLAWLILAASSLIFIPIAADFAGLPFLRELSARKLLDLDKLSTQEALLAKKELLAMDYISTGEPPPNFEKWITFAKQNKCHLGPYHQIERDLQGFRETSSPYRVRITKAQLQAAKDFSRVTVFTIKNGHVTHTGSTPNMAFAEQFSILMARISKFLPDMEFVVNDLDEPRILPGTTSDLPKRFSSLQCANASEGFKKFRHLHGSFNSRSTHPMYMPTNELLPIFSQSKINNCFADITYPTLYGLNNLLTPEQELELVPWKDRNATLFFRGSSTGGHWPEGTDFRKSHRQRLVSFAAGKPGMDIAFTAFKQCEENVCREMEQVYGVREMVEQMDNFKHKFLMSIDGNTFVSRLPLFMSSGSVPFRSGLYSEWFDEWLLPFQHFLPVKLDYSNLQERLDWAVAHDQEARLIGLQARQFAKTRLRNQDMECYLFRLLLEYSNVLER